MFYELLGKQNQVSGKEVDIEPVGEGGEEHRAEGGEQGGDEGRDAHEASNLEQEERPPT